MGINKTGPIIWDFQLLILRRGDIKEIWEILSLSLHSRVLIVWVGGVFFLGRREEDSGGIGREEEVSSGGAAVKEHCRAGRSNHIGSCSHQEERDGMGGRGTSPRLSLPGILRDW